MEKNFEHPAYRDYKVKDGDDTESYEEAGVTNSEGATLRAIKHAFDTNDSELLDKYKEKYEEILSANIQKAIEQKNYSKVQEIASILSLMQKNDYSFLKRLPSEIAEEYKTDKNEEAGEKTENVFPDIAEKESNDYIEFKKIAKNLPAIKEAEYDTVEKKLGGENKEERDKILNSIDYLKSKLGDIYNLEKLTEKELFSLEEGLKKFDSEDNLRKIGHFIDYFGDIDQYTHDQTERKQLKKIRAAYEEHKKLKIQNFTLQRIIEDIYPVIIKSEESEEFSTARGFTKKIATPTPHRAFAKKFILEEVIAKREPKEEKNCFENIKAILDFDKKILQPHRKNYKFPDLQFEIKKLEDLEEAFLTQKRLSGKQRDFAYNLIRAIKKKFDSATKE